MIYGHKFPGVIVTVPRVIFYPLKLQVTVPRKITGKSKCCFLVFYIDLFFLCVVVVSNVIVLIVLFVPASL